MSKATHIGICQACGNTQRLPNGLLSNHGYTIKWGFFEGTCMGAKHLPFEKSCELIKSCIESAKRTKQNFLDQIDKLKKNESNISWFHHYVSGRGGGYRVWREAEVSEGLIIYNYMDKEAKVPSRRYSLHGTDLEIAKKLDEKKIKWIESRIKEVDNYIEWQENRIKDWKEQPLTPIEEKK